MFENCSSHRTTPGRWSFSDCYLFCYNKWPQTQWLTMYTFIALWLWRPKFQMGVTGLKSRCGRSLFFLEALRQNLCCGMPFPASRGHPHSSPGGPFPYFESQQHWGVRLSVSALQSLLATFKDPVIPGSPGITQDNLLTFQARWLAAFITPAKVILLCPVTQDTDIQGGFILPQHLTVLLQAGITGKVASSFVDLKVGLRTNPRLSAPLRLYWRIFRWLCSLGTKYTVFGAKKVLNKCCRRKERKDFALLPAFLFFCIR